MADVVKSLKDIVKKYPMVLNDDKKLKSILKDYFPEDKRIQNHLYMVYEEGILEDMQGSKEIKKFKMVGYIHSLAEDYGIPESMSKEAIMTWAKALNIKAEDVKVDDSLKNGNKPKKVGKIIDYSNSGSDDIEIKGSILKFKGKGNKIINGVRLESETYIVKTTGEPYVKFYDYKRNKTYICQADESPCEEIWKKNSIIDIKKEGIIEVSNSNEKWTIEMIPI